MYQNEHKPVVHITARTAAEELLCKLSSHLPNNFKRAGICKEYLFCFVVHLPCAM